jgi:G8 domain
MRLAVLIGLTFILTACNSADSSHHSLNSSALPHNIPNFCATPTVSAKQNGNWSDGQIWTKALVNNDVLEIPVGRSVVLDLQSNTRIKCLAVKGTLRFRTDVNTRLRVGTLMILEGGRLEVGTASAPIQSGVSAEIIELIETY